MKRPILAVLGLFLAFTSSLSAHLTFDDVNTKYAANLALWWGKGKPVIDKVEKAHALGFEAIEFWAYGKEDIDGIAKKTKELGIKVAQFTA
ncbi:hypothetical protein N9023_07345, partial [Opitutaceae bacterium]|nr:hypothetical protein [Opitutaceae bacterium]